MQTTVKTKKATTLKTYTQGRYRCIVCHDFDCVELGDFAMPEYMKCPTCHYDAQLLTQARGMGIDPPLGVSKPGGMERRLGQFDKEDRGSRAHVGYRTRKFEDCTDCELSTYTKTGAIDRADDMTSQHGRNYKIYPCPFGPGFHVQPMEA